MNSDPGTSGILSPFANIDGLYFNNDPEPDDFFFNLMKDIEDRCWEKGIQYIKCDFESSNDFYNALSSLQKYADDNVSVSGTSREGHYEIIIDGEVDIDEAKKSGNEEKKEDSNKEENDQKE